MRLTKSLFFLLAITAFAIASTILAVFNYNPFTSSGTVLVNFYVSLLVALAGTIAFLLYFIKTGRSKNETIYHFFWPSVRQASFISFAIVALLYLKGNRVLDWLIGISVVVIVALLELFFESKKIKPSIKKKKEDEAR